MKIHGQGSTRPFRPLKTYTPKTSRVGTTTVKPATPASTLTRAVSIPAFTAAGSGPCANTRASATAAESNARFRYLFERGQTGLSVAFDLPTQIGLDSDHPLSRGEVGRVGVAIDSLEDMEALFKDIPLERVSTSMTINATAAILLALYLAVAEKQGADLRKLSGTVQNDILKEYIARGTYIYPLGARHADW